MTALLRTTLLLATAATLAAQKPIAVEASVKTADFTNREAPPPVVPVSETTTLSSTAPAGVTLPEGLQDARYGTVKLAGKTIVIAAGKTAADAERTDTLWIDGNADGKWTPEEKLSITVDETPGRGNQPGGERSEPVDVTLRPNGKELTGKATFMKAGNRDPMVGVSFPAYLEAKVDVGGTERIVAIVDKNLDGTFGSKDDLWTLAKPGDRPAQAFALSLLGEKRFVDGHLVGIAVAPNNTVQVTTTPATGPDPKDAAAHRTRVEHDWFERFDKERDQFVEARKLDTKRARATTPIAWNYVSFDEAIALGKKANKPVFVDVMAFWCVWCYRMDYYTYVDQEVAELLNTQFVPCKVIQEQDLAGDYDKLMKEKLEARGIPAMGIFDTEGDVLVKIGGWSPPEDTTDPQGKVADGFVTQLRKGLEAFRAAQGGGK